MIIIMSEEERYNNRQIEKMFSEQSEDLKDHFDQKIEPLTTAVNKTNGRVGWLEKMVWLATGAVIILTPLTYWLATQVVNEKTEQATITQQAVSEALSQYNIKVSP